MATPSGSPPLAPTAPVHTVRGAHNSLLIVMTGLGHRPDTGRLLRGLVPYLDEYGADHVLLLAERRRKEPWRGDDGAVAYQEIVHWDRNGREDTFRGVCGMENMLTLAAITELFHADPLTLIDRAAEEMRAAVISSTQPLRLQTLYVEKPWGREGWYTGIERRGVCKITSDPGETELPYALGLFPLALLGQDEPELILLKTLEPRPDPVWGDLYLEVHEEKWETYLVLEVDRRAWPDGTGHLRAGLDARTMKRYRRKHGDQAERILISDLREKIAAYETVRREIDGLLDEALEARGLPLDEPAPEEVVQEIIASLPARIGKSEAKLRAEAEAFIGNYPLREGDVACLPPGVLHSLQPVP